MKTTQLKASTLVFVDEHLEEFETLSARLSHDAVLALLNHDENIFAQIATRLKERDGINAIHVITHGRAGEMVLGDKGASLETLPLYGKELTAIANAIRAQGEIYLYGCEVASGERGAAFVKMLGDLTGLKIAAATHKVGHSELGGSWELDAAPMVMSGALEVSEWRGVLATTIPLVLDGTLLWKRPDYFGYLDSNHVYQPNYTDLGAGEVDQFGTFDNDPAFIQGDTDYSYSYVTFTVSEAGNYSFKITNTTVDDLVMFLYGSDFTVDEGTKQPSGTFIIGDDDSWDTYFDAGYNIDTGGTTADDDWWSGLKDVPLGAGTYTLVFSSFAPTDTGSITLEASGNNGTVTVTGGTVTGLTGVTASHTFSETVLQAEPQLLDSDVTFSYDNAKLTNDYTEQNGASNYATLYVNYVQIVPDGDTNNTNYDDVNDTYYDPANPSSYTNYQVGNNALSLKSNGLLQFTSSEGDGDVLYNEQVIGYLQASNNGFEISFDQAANPTAVMIDKIIESITLSVNDYPVEQSKFRIVLKDNNGDTTDPVYVDVTVEGVNDAPVLSTAVGLKTVNMLDDDDEYSYSVATLSDGSIIVAGVAFGDTDYDDDTEISNFTVLTKYAADGTLDTTFGTNGKVIVAPAEEWDNPQIAIDGNGKIVLSGIYGYTDNQLNQWDTVKSIGVMRYNVDGSLDTSFAADTNNVAIYRQDSVTDMYGTPKVAIFSDNSIAVTYPGDGTDFAVAKFTSIGVLDTGFGTDGVQSIDMATSSSDEVNDIAINSDGNMILVGNVEDAVSMGLLILNGTTGAQVAKTVTSAENDDVWSAFGTDIEANAVAVQSDGKILVAGRVDGEGSNNALLLARYTDAGVLDNTFGTGGKVVSTLMEEAGDVVIDSNGKILVLSDDGDMKVARFNTNGTLDDTFGVDGVAEVTSGDGVRGYALEIGTGGDIWIVGYTRGDDREFAIAKLSANGVPDATFGDQAVYTTYGDPVILNGGISVFDGELSDNDNDDFYFSGATISIARQGGANPLDIFSAAEGSDLTLIPGATENDPNIVEYDGDEIGTYSNTGGTLSITFNDYYTEQDVVNGVMRNIAYQYGDDTVANPTDINLVWTFNDGNTGEEGRTDQGSGGVLSTTLVQTLNIAIGEAPTPPEVTSTPITTVDEGTQYNYILAATDDTEVTWSVKEDTELPDWLTLGKGDAAVTLADDFMDPGGMAYDEATGDIYATANSAFSVMYSRGLITNSKIYKIDEDGNKTLFTEHLPGQIGSMVVVNGYLYAGYVSLSEDSVTGLYRYDLSDTDGSVTPELVMNGEITGVALNDGKLYVTDYELGVVYELDPEGLSVPIADENLEDYVYVDVSELGAIPYGITFDSNGVMYGTFFMSQSVFKYDGINPAENIMTADNGDIPDGRPSDIKIDAVGNLYISYFGGAMYGNAPSGIYKFDSDLNPLDPINTTTNSWSMIINNDGKIIAGDVQIDMQKIADMNGAQTQEEALVLLNEAYGESEIFAIDTANWSLSGTPPMVDADTEHEITLVATDADGSETEHTFTITVNDVPEPVSSVTLDVNNPFTTNDLTDTTAITITAPEGINITDATNSPVSGLPKNVKMPLGQFAFTLEGVEVGGTVEMSMTADADFKQFSYFKKNLVTNKWVNIAEGTTINEDGTGTVKFSLTDGGIYDADRTANGVIVDPGGVGENALLPMIIENTTEVGNISLLDNTLATGTLSYAITGGADAAKFGINETTGLLSFLSAPNYEAPNDAGDTINNNTYAVQVTVTGSTSGSEVQNLIVSVLNVAEDGDNLNTAPVIVGLRAEAQAVTVGTAAALDDIRVVDADGDMMTVTLSATNGTIGGLTDADADTDGIQLTGTAAAINAALAGATFTASAAGAAGVSLSAVDTNVDSGTAITTTAFYEITAAAPAPTPVEPAPTPVEPEPMPVEPEPTPEQNTQTVDGATVVTTTTTQTRVTTDENGNAVTTTVTTEQIVIAPVTDSRTDSIGTSVTADVPLFWGESSRTEWATTASLPTGMGLQSEGSRAPAGAQSVQSALADLIYFIDTTTPNSDQSKNGILGGGEQFLSALNNIETLIVNKVTLTTNSANAPSAPITISGTANAVQTTNGQIAPVEALVIDASALPAGTVLNLQNIEFAVIVGDGITVHGGEGKNILFAGAGSQNIVLGENDDELYAGAGNDVVGSVSGDDKIYGEDGNDTLFGGSGRDILSGGTGSDTLNGGLGYDIALQEGSRSDYAIEVTNGTITLTDTINNTVDRLNDINQIEFESGEILYVANNTVQEKMLLVLGHTKAEIIYVPLAQTITGTDTNNTFELSENSHGLIIDAKGGYDVLNVTGSFANFKIEQTERGVEITSLINGTMAELKNFESITFSDGNNIAIVDNEISVIGSTDLNDLLIG